MPEPGPRSVIARRRRRCEQTHSPPHLPPQPSRFCDDSRLPGTAAGRRGLAECRKRARNVPFRRKYDSGHSSVTPDRARDCDRTERRKRWSVSWGGPAISAVPSRPGVRETPPRTPGSLHPSDFLSARIASTSGGRLDLLRPRVGPTATSTSRDSEASMSDPWRTAGGNRMARAAGSRTTT